MIYEAPRWHDDRLEAAYGALDDAMMEIHPEHSEHDKLRIARDAVEDADIALQKYSKRGRPKSRPKRREQVKPIDDLRARAFAALTDDLIEGKGFQRLEALRQISTRDGSAPNKPLPADK